MTHATTHTPRLVSTRPTGIMVRLRRSDTARGYTLLSPALLVLIFGVVLPFLILLIMSFWTREGFGFDTAFTTANYARTANEPIFGAFLMRSFRVSGIATAVTVLLCYPMAYCVAFDVHRNKMLWIILMTLPFWASYLLRVFAWKVILGYEGVINASLLSMGLIEKPLEFLLYSETAVIITLDHAWAAFAILPLYVSLGKIDRSLLEAAADLGENGWWTFWRVTFPMVMPGIIAVRPEKLSMHMRQPTSDQPSIQGTLEITTYLGERSQFHVRVPDIEQTLAISAQNSCIQGEPTGARNRPVWLTWSDGALINPRDV